MAKDIQGAAREIVSAAFPCTGQRCTALSRVIVLESQVSELIENLESEVERRWNVCRDHDGSSGQHGATSVYRRL